MLFTKSIEDMKNSVRTKHSELCDVLGGLSKSSKVSAGRSTDTGILSLDIALGGGLPSGAVELYGEYSCGKTTILYEILRQAQNNGFIVALCPTEYLDVPYMKEVGVDLASLVTVTGHGEYVLHEAMTFLRRHREERLLLSFDTVTSLRPTYGSSECWPSMIGYFLEKALPILNPSSSIVMTNQVRGKYSVDPRNFFVKAEVDTAAKKLVSQFSTRMFLAKGSTKGGEKDIVVDIVANTLARPARMIRLPLGKRGGINKLLDLFRLSLDVGLISKEGSWFTLGDTRLGPGLDKAVEQIGQKEAMLRYIISKKLV